MNSSYDINTLRHKWSVCGSFVPSRKYANHVPYDVVCKYIMTTKFIYLEQQFLQRHSASCCDLWLRTVRYCVRTWSDIYDECWDFFAILLPTKEQSTATFRRKGVMVYHSHKIRVWVRVRVRVHCNMNPILISEGIPWNKKKWFSFWFLTPSLPSTLNKIWFVAGGLSVTTILKFVLGQKQTQTFTSEVLYRFTFFQYLYAFLFFSFFYIIR